MRTESKSGGWFPLAFALLWGGAGFLLFFLQLVVPTTYDLATTILLVLVLWMAGMAIVWSGKTGLHRSVLLWFCLFVAVGTFYLAYGVLRNNPGALPSAKTLIIYPLCYMILLSGIRSVDVLQWVHRILVAAAIFIGAYALSYILNVLGLWPDALYLQLDAGQAIGFHQGYMEFRLFAIPSLLFLAPYLLAVILQGSFNKLGLRNSWSWLALSLVIVVSFLSGRRSLIFLVMLSPVLILIFSHFLPPRQRASLWRRGKISLVVVGLLAALAVVGVSLFYDFDVQDFWRMLLSGFDAVHSDSAQARYAQFIALVRGWSSQPLFGAGIGASLEGMIRSQQTPWAFELSYVELVYHVGLIGIAYYATSIGWIYWKAVRILRSGKELAWDMFPIIVGTTSFLLGNASNPYLGKFAYLWVVFLPIAVINIWLLGLTREDGNKRA